MSFRKYPSIENSYRQKEIDWWLRRYPELRRDRYILQEKLHGANVSFEFKPNGDWFFGKRTSRLGTGDNFYGCWGIMDQYEDFIKTWLAAAKHDDVSYRIFGEIFGSNIQQGVDYGPDKRMRFYDMFRDDAMVAPVSFIDMMKDAGYGHLLVPTIAIVDGLQEALNFDIEFNTKEGPDVEGNLCEGVVIKPYNKTYSIQDTSYFRLKNKNAKFKEKQRAKKSKVINMPENVEKLRAEFESYITKQRLEGIFSKYGEIEKPSQIGNYIQYMMKDAIEDFNKDFDIKELKKKERKYVFNVGQAIVQMLYEYL
jgi:Rnl2 family RNA ligase